MILLDNNYCSKYWFTEEIKDCSNNNDNDELDFELIMDDEKLKDNHYFFFQVSLIICKLKKRKICQKLRNMLLRIQRNIL